MVVARSIHATSYLFKPLGAKKPFAHSVSQLPYQTMPSCPANREKDVIDQDLEKFWAHQRKEINNSTGSQEKLALPMARIMKVMKSDREVHKVSRDCPALLAKACEIFIQEATLRAWKQTQSCFRKIILSSDIHKSLQDSIIYEELSDLVTFECSQSVPQDEVVHQQGEMVHQQACTSANVPEMEAPIDIDQNREQRLFNLTSDQSIESGEFELGPHIQGVPQDEAVHQQVFPSTNLPEMEAPIDLDQNREQWLFNLTSDQLIDDIGEVELGPHIQGVPEGEVVHQQVCPSANMPEMEAPIDLDQNLEQWLFNLTSDQSINSGEFELGPHIQGVPQGEAVHPQVCPSANVPEMEAPIDLEQNREKWLFNLTADQFVDDFGEVELGPHIQ